MDSQPPAQPPPGEEDNPYLRLRREKIARNNARLESLGLLRKDWATPRSTAAAAASAAAEARRRGNGGGPSSSSSCAAGRRTKAIPSEPLRRSARNSGRGVDYKELPDASRVATGRTGQTHVKAGKKRGRADQYDDDEDEEDADRATTMTISSKPSTRTTDANVGAVVGRWLGTQLDSFGKAAVIDAAVDAASSLSAEEEGGDDRRRPPPVRISFNKYSGVCEWRNAIFLWVNIGAPGADVVNDFSDGGRKMTWFGGSRMHDDTPAIKRLVRLGRKAQEEGSLPDTDGIVLWCRLYDSSKRAFGNYVCLGRVAYDSHVPGLRPMEFLLRLLDFDGMVAAQNGKSASVEPSLFRQIVDF